MRGKSLRACAFLSSLCLTLHPFIHPHIHTYTHTHMRTCAPDLTHAGRSTFIPPPPSHTHLIFPPLPHPLTHSPTHPLSHTLAFYNSGGWAVWKGCCDQNCTSTTASAETSTGHVSPPPRAPHPCSLRPSLSQPPPLPPSISHARAQHIAGSSLSLSHIQTLTNTHAHTHSDLQVHGGLLWRGPGLSVSIVGSAV